MLFLVLFFIVLLLWLIANHLHVKAVQRTNRLLRRVPCVNCGNPLLPAARTCPNCYSLQPLRGWAGLGAQMPQLLNAARRDWWVWGALAGCVTVAVLVANLLSAVSPPKAVQPALHRDVAAAHPAPPPQPAPAEPASQPLNRMDRCVAMLGAQDVANGHVGGYGAALERRKWCEANWRSGK
jgi:hypothetical protein